MSRDAVARYLFAHRQIVLRRIVGKLRHATRIEPDDVLSSVLRRVDKATAEGFLRAHTEAQFWSYVNTIADNLVKTRLRRAARDRAARHDLSLSQLRVGSAFPPTESIDTAQINSRLATDLERELVRFRIAGVPYAVIAALTGRSPEVLRASWSALLRQLRGIHRKHRPSRLARGRRPSCGPMAAPNPPSSSQST